MQESQSNQESHKKSNDNQKCNTNASEGVPVSVRSSSDLEEVTTPDATFVGVALVAREARERVEVPGGRVLGQTGRKTSIACVHIFDLAWVP